MSISDNKRVVTLASVMGLAFAGIVYFGITKQQEYSAAEAELTDINDRIEGYKAQEPTPTKQNIQILNQAKQDVTAVSKDMTAAFDKYAKFCTGQPKVTPQEFQKQLLADIAAVRTLAADKKVPLARFAEDLGMVSYKTKTPTENEVPFLAFQHKAVQRVVEDIINSAPASMEKVYCEDLPEGASLDNKKPAEYLPLRFEVAFEAKRGTIPAVINKIMEDKEFFLMITGIAVQGMESLPPVSTYTPPATAAEAQGDDLAGGDAEGGNTPAAAPPARIIAAQLTGKADETTHVHMTFQVLYFNPKDSKKK